MTWYLLYAKGTKEIEVAEAIRELGIETICALQLLRKRTGRTTRDVVFFDAPILHNLIVANIDSQDYMKVMEIKHLAKTAMFIPDRAVTGFQDCNGEWRDGVMDFAAAAQRQYEAQEKTRDNLGAVVEYDEGQDVRLLSGAWDDFALKFRKMVHHAGDPFPKVQMVTEFMGRESVVEADPLDVVSSA